MDSLPVTVSIAIDENNHAPRMNELPSQTLTEGVTRALRFMAVDDDAADTLTYALAWIGPAGSPNSSDLTFDPASGILLWAPDEDDGGQDYLARITASDDAASPLTNSLDVTFNVAKSGIRMSIWQARGICSSHGFNRRPSYQRWVRGANDTNLSPYAT